MAAMDAHGGWVASAVDLVRFAAAVDPSATHSILSPAARNRLFAPPPGPIGHRKAAASIAIIGSAAIAPRAAARPSHSKSASGCVSGVTAAFLTAQSRWP